MENARVVKKLFLLLTKEHMIIIMFVNTCFVPNSLNPYILKIRKVSRLEVQGSKSYAFTEMGIVSNV